MTERREHWLSMANDDLAFAELGLSNGFFSQVCFLSQQASEKALKAVLLSRTGGYPRVHSIVDLVKRNDAVEALAGLMDDARILDQYYIPTRYPDGVPGSLPDGLPSEEHAKQALTIAKTVVGQCEQVLR